MESSCTRGQTDVSCTARCILNHLTTGEVLRVSLCTMWQVLSLCPTLADCCFQTLCLGFSSRILRWFCIPLSGIFPNQGIELRSPACSDSAMSESPGKPKKYWVSSYPCSRGSSSQEPNPGSLALQTDHLIDELSFNNFYYAFGYLFHFELPMYKFPFLILGCLSFYFIEFGPVTS